MWLLSLVGSKVARVAGLALAAISFIVGLIHFGKRQERKDQKLRDMKEYIDKKRKSDEVPISTDRESALKRLRKSKHVRDE